MVKCKIVSYVIISKIEVQQIGDVKYFEVDTGFHKFYLKNKTEDRETLSFHSGYSFEFQEDSNILQDQLAKNPIRLTLSNNDIKLAEGESYWPRHIHESINGSHQEFVHIVKCKLNSETVKFDVIELIVRLKVTPIKSIDINQQHRISLIDNIGSKVKTPKNTVQIFKELARTYQTTEKSDHQLKAKNDNLPAAKQKVKKKLKESRIKEKPQRLAGGMEPEIKKKKCIETLKDSNPDSFLYKQSRLKGGGLCAEKCHSSNTKKKKFSKENNMSTKPDTFENAKHKIPHGDSQMCSGRFFSNFEKEYLKKSCCKSDWESNKPPEETKRAHLATVMNEMDEMYKIFYLTQIREGKQSESIIYRKHDHMENLKQQFDQQQRKQQNLQRIYKLMKHPLLRNCMSHIGKRRN